MEQHIQIKNLPHFNVLIFVLKELKCDYSIVYDCGTTLDNSTQSTLPHPESGREDRKAVMLIVDHEFHFSEVDGDAFDVDFGEPVVPVRVTFDFADDDEHGSFAAEEKWILEKFDAEIELEHGGTAASFPFKIYHLPVGKTMGTGMMEFNRLIKNAVEGMCIRDALSKIEVEG